MNLINDKVFSLSESFTFSTMNEVLFIAYQGSNSAGRYLWNWKNWNYICYFVFNNDIENITFLNQTVAQLRVYFVIYYILITEKQL